MVLPLVAIATPIEYMRNPLRVFELDFEENLRVVRYCVKYGKRVIFPVDVRSLRHVRRGRVRRGQLQPGARADSQAALDLLLQQAAAGPGHLGLRPAGRAALHAVPAVQLDRPRLDSLDSARIGSSRAITQLILNLVEGTPIQLVDGGDQKRCFTDVADGIECLFRIIENENSACDGQIINIGNPDNEASIRELAEMLVEEFERHPLRQHFPPFAGILEVESGTYYGKGYQDVQHRRPSIRNARRILGWQPTVPMRESIATTLDFFLREYVAEHAAAGKPEPTRAVVA